MIVIKSYRTTEAYIHVADQERRSAANKAVAHPALTVVAGGKSQTALANAEKADVSGETLTY